MLLSPLPGIVQFNQPFGANPQIYAPDNLKGHDGMDFGCPVGTQLYAPIEGFIAQIGDDGPTTGFGKYIRIHTFNADDQGRIREILLGHLSSIPVAQGQFVHQLDPIVLSGNTGHSTGPHVHFELRFLDKYGSVMNYGNGYKGAVDPEPYFRCWTLPTQQQAYLQKNY